MVFTSPRCNVNQVGQLLFDNTVIFRTDVVRYLGFIIDSKLTWHYYIFHVRDKVNKGLGMLRRCSCLLPIDCSLSIYYMLLFTLICLMVYSFGV